MSCVMVLGSPFTRTPRPSAAPPGRRGSVGGQGPPHGQRAQRLRLVEGHRGFPVQVQQAQEPGHHLEGRGAAGDQFAERRGAALGQQRPQHRGVLGHRDPRRVDVIEVDRRRRFRAEHRRRPWRRTAPASARSGSPAAARGSAPRASPPAGTGAAHRPRVRRTAPRPAGRRGRPAAGRTAGPGPGTCRRRRSVSSTRSSGSSRAAFRSSRVAAITRNSVTWSRSQLLPIARMWPMKSSVTWCSATSVTSIRRWLISCSSRSNGPSKLSSRTWNGRRPSSRPLRLRRCRRRRDRPLPGCGGATVIARSLRARAPGRPARPGRSARRR